jgi:hypothetical protein
MDINRFSGLAVANILQKHFQAKLNEYADNGSLGNMSLDVPSAFYVETNDGNVYYVEIKGIVPRVLRDK